MRSFTIVFNLIGYKVKSLTYYPISFIIGFVSQWLSYGSGILVIFAIMKNFTILNGWRTYEILFLCGFTLMSYAIGASFACPAATTLPKLIAHGEIDSVLTKPVYSLAYIIASEYSISYLAHFTISLIIICISAFKLKLYFSFLNLIWFSVSLLGSALIQASFILLTSFYSFKSVGTSPFSTLYWNTRDFLNFPMSLFLKDNVFLQIFFTAVIPYTFVSFFPCQYFLNKNDLFFFPPVIKYGTPLVGIVLTFMTVFIWNLIIKRYTSSGT